MFNSFGNIFRLTSFGESHGPGVGGVIDGFPAGIKVDMDFVQQELNRRRPGQSGNKLTAFVYMVVVAFHNPGAALGYERICHKSYSDKKCKGQNPKENASFCNHFHLFFTPPR